MKKHINYRLRYSIIGFSVGLSLPVIGLVLFRLLQLSADFLMYIVFMAPFIMALMAFFNGRSRDLLNEANDELEFAVRQRTQSIRSMLDISGQAVFTFDSSYRVLPEYSSFCEDFFGGPIYERDVRSLLFDSDDAREDFIQGVDLLFQEKAQPAVVFDLMDRELTINEKLTDVVYRFIPPDRVLVGLTDITESKSLSQQLIQEERSKEMIFTAVSHQNYFRDLLRDAEELFFHLDSIIAGDIQEGPRVVRLQQMLHTFRGNLSFFRFNNTHDLVDELETYIGDMISLGEPLEFRGSGLALKRVYFQELRKIVDTLGEDWLQGVDAVQVPRRQFQQLINYVNQHYKTDRNLKNSLQTFYKVTFASLFTQYPHMARALASRLGKKLADMEIHGGDFMVMPDRYRELATASVHLIRNMIDHGIETPWERQEQGKSEVGTIDLRIIQQEKSIILRFADDGRGINFTSVAQRALSRGLIDDIKGTSRGQLIKLLFRGGFSTSESVDSVSGKGIGLSAVKAAVKKLGGTIQVRTQDTKGSVFTIDIPRKDGE